MALTYSTACEEMAYSKDSGALREAADASFDQGIPNAERRAVEYLRRWFGTDEGVWFSWWGNHDVALVFKGSESDALARIRAVDDRPMD